MFLESGGNWGVVEMSVKRWYEAKNSLINTEREVTKEMLRKVYHYDECNS